MNILLLSAGIVLLAGCDTAPTNNPANPKAAVDPDTLGAANLEVWMRFENSDYSRTHPAPTPDFSPILWFSPQGMQTCEAISGFTKCNLIFPKPLTLAKMQERAYYMYGMEMIEARTDFGFQGSYQSTTYRPKPGSFPPEGWGEYRTPKVTHDSLVKSIQGGWYLALIKGVAAGRGYDSAYSEADAKGTLLFSGDSVYLEADSAGTPQAFASRFEIDAEERILTGGAALPEAFMKDMPDIVNGGPIRDPQTGLPEVWGYAHQPDTLRFERKYGFAVGMGPYTVWETETVVFLRATARIH